MVIRTSQLIPEMRQGLFECSLCRNVVEVEIDRGRVEEPTLCQHCHTNHSFQLIHNRCLFMDKQMIKLQESPGTKLAHCLISIRSVQYLTSSIFNRRYACRSNASYCNFVRARRFGRQSTTRRQVKNANEIAFSSEICIFCLNFRITVTGIYRAVPLRINPKQRTVKAVYKTYVDVLHFRKTDIHRLHTQDDG